MDAHSCPKRGEHIRTQFLWKILLHECPLHMSPTCEAEQQQHARDGHSDNLKPAEQQTAR
jgi:hypothetical protein